MLLPLEESRKTVEFGDHYTVHPSFHWWNKNDHMVENGERGTPVTEEFEYASNKNDQWLDKDQLLAMLEE